MIKTGLVSVTFRQLSPEEIIKYSINAGIDGIEWGGDIHVPHGNLEQAKKVGNLTLNAGLEIISYGSYYRLDESENNGLAFKSVLQTAKSLGTSIIRIWAGCTGSAQTTPGKWNAIVADAVRIADMAADADISLSLEYHDKTLTDTAESALKLIDEIACDNMRLYWQTTNGASFAENINNLKLLLNYITNIHVFNWQSYTNRFPLAAGSADWLEYLKILQNTGHNRFASLEFVKDDAPEMFLKDAATLKTLIQQSKSYN